MPTFGFHPVTQIQCAPDEPGMEIPVATQTSVEVIARRGSRHVAADASGVYWTEGVAGGAGGDGGVYRASREGIVGTWRVEPLAREEEDPAEIAAADGHVYWVGGRRAVRFYEKSSRRVGTVADEEAPPERIVAQGASAFWIAPPNHLREARDAPGRPTLRNLLTTTLVPSLLAADAQAVYAFTPDHSLLRVPRDGARPIVLVPTTETRPIDIAVEGGWVYWLEEGPEIDDAATCRSSGYELSSAPRGAAGALHRVAAELIGPVEDVAKNLPNVRKLALLSGVAWITTASGRLRVPVSPSSKGHITYQPLAGPAALPLEGRLAAIGDALVLGTSGSGARVLLLTSP
jgi:hypothetical protein